MNAGGRLGATAAALAALVTGMALAAGSAHAATSELVGRRSVAPGVERLHYRYGPLVAGAGQNLILAGPATVERPLGDGYATRVAATLVGPDGTAPPVERVHMHHAVMLNMSRKDATAPDLPGERFYGFAEEKTVGRLPQPYGYPLKATDVIAVNYMLHNGTPDNQVVYIDYELDWIQAGTPQADATIAARPLWVDVENGKAYPVFDVARGSGTKGRFTYPDDAGDPYAGGPRRNEWTADRDGTLVFAAGHLHPGGLAVDLDVVRGDRRARAFRSSARYFDPNGPVSWDMAMTITPEDWRVAVRKGDRLRVSTVYETERASWYESMGLALVYMADGGGGRDPFAEKVDAPGDVTHGHLPEAGNYGGAATGLPDARRLPDGQTVADGVAIDNFVYTPGDLTAPGALGSPPVVAPGSSLRFGNFDAAAQIPHTVTACRAPCNRSTGVSYPLADGDPQFDSGQLGYGPQGYTAAAQRPDWYSPKDLRPGTYTYFCRVHPYMRGAFRVPGDPGAAASPGAGPGRATVLSRRARARRGVVALRLRCAGGGDCAGVLRLSVRRGRRSMTIGRRSYRIGTGRTGVVRVRLNRAGRALLKRRGSLRVTASAAGARRVVRVAR